MLAKFISSLLLHQPFICWREGADEISDGIQKVVTERYTFGVKFVLPTYQKILKISIFVNNSLLTNFDLLSVNAIYCVNFFETYVFVSKILNLINPLWTISSR